MFIIFVILFTAIPVLELYLLLEAGKMWGGFNTILVVLFTGIFGAYFAKQEGRNVLLKLQQKLGQGGLPANELIHGALIFSGGLLLLTPGFLTDFVGFCFIFPLSRMILTAMAKAYFSKRIASGSIKVYSNFSQKYSDQMRMNFEETKFDDEEKNIKDIN